MPNVRFINPPEMAKPTGYSHVAEVAGGRLVYIAGQVALDRDGRLVGAGDLRAQTLQVFENLKAALASVGGDFGNVIKMNYYVLDASQRMVVRDVRSQYLDAENPPASTFVQVTALVLDDFLIEIEAVAVVP
jgi:enamine deaminase RidA (YjgF/YER057c/UK114 family)